MFYVIGLSNIRGIVINRIVVVIESQNKAIVCSIARTDDGCFFFGNSTGSSCVKHPRGTDVNAFAEFMVESQINIMAPIIFCLLYTSTVNRHRQNILEKLSVGNSIEACRAAELMKLL